MSSQLRTLLVFGSEQWWPGNTSSQAQESNYLSPPLIYRAGGSSSGSSSSNSEVCLVLFNHPKSSTRRRGGVSITSPANAPDVSCYYAASYCASCLSRPHASHGSLTPGSPTPPRDRAFKGYVLHKGNVLQDNHRSLNNTPFHGYSHRSNKLI